MEGNQNEMRDALLKLRAEIGLFYNNEWIPYDAWQGCEDVISHALSAPARNCDRFRSEAERRDAFIDWYNEAYDLKGSDAIDTCDLKHDVDGILHDYIDWLFTTKKGEGDGK